MNADRDRLPNKKLLKARLERNWSQRELAARVGTTFVNVSRWERGVTTPGTYYRHLLCQLFEKTSAELGLLPEETTQLSVSETVPISLAEMPEPGAMATLPLWRQPHQRNPFFTGREEELLQLHTWLMPSPDISAMQSVTLSGLGGIGKTQTATEYSYRFAANYTAIFWIEAETAERLAASFLAIADRLKLPERQGQEKKSVVAAVQAWLYTHHQWLLIFDNVEDIELVRSFLPSAHHGSLLFTSRQYSLDLSAHVLHLHTMTQAEGWLFFQRRLRWSEQAVRSGGLRAADEKATRTLIAALDGLPLALDQAASYIESTRCRPEDYLQLLNASPLQVLNERESHAEHPQSVSKTFALALHFLEEHNPEAVDILTVCAYLAPEALPEAFFIQGSPWLGPSFQGLADDPLRFHRAMKALLSCSLVQRDPETRSVTVQRLIQVVLKASQSEELQRTWRGRVLSAISEMFPLTDAIDPAKRELGAQLLPHALICIAACEQEFAQEQYIPWICAAAGYLMQYTRYVEAKALYQRVQQGIESTPETSSALLAYPLRGLAQIAMEQGNYDEAEALFRQALEVRAELEEEDTFTTALLSDLALLSWRQGRFEQAELLYRRVIHTRERVLGPEHPEVALPLTGLAVLYWQQGRPELVEPLYVRALQAFGPQHPGRVHTLHGLADLYRQQRNYERAEELFQQALHLQQSLLGPEHPHVARLWWNLALLYSDQGRYAEAETLCRRALHMQEQILGPEHPDIGQVLHGLAELAHRQGRTTEAEELYLRSLHTLENTSGQEHLLVAYPLVQLALLYTGQGRSVEARTLLERALHIRLTSLGKLHPETQEVTRHLKASEVRAS